MELPAIDFADVSKRYGDVLALDHVSFSVKEGEVLGFLGPNGAGKTTAIRLLFDLIRPTSGRATILGRDCQHQGVEAREHMGYLPGDLRLYDGLAGQQLIDLFASLRGGAISRSYLRELTDRLALDLTRPIAGLSTGTRQKLGLVLALMPRPRVLVLDEPTAGLDPLMQEEIESILLELAAEGSTVFFSSHMLSEVERICQRVAIIRKGRVVAVEDVGDLKGRSLHFIEVTFACDVPPGVFAVDGVREARRDGRLIHLEVRSNLDAALKAIAKYPVIDLRTEQPSLEDIFLAYYEEGAAAGLQETERTGA